MPWTIVDDDPLIQVRATIHREHDQEELRKLIAALEKRITSKETDNERPATS